MAEQLATLVPPADRLRIADDLTERLAQRADGLRTAVSTLTAGQPQPVLLIVDQFEEIFTLCQEEDERCRERVTRFAANLSDAVTRGNGSIRVVITLRADFLDRCLAYGELRELLQDRQVLLGALTESALRDAIVRPAQEVGAFFEKGLDQSDPSGCGDGARGASAVAACVARVVAGASGAVADSRSLRNQWRGARRAPAARGDNIWALTMTQQAIARNYSFG